ncbi:MAG: hypothetical protein HYZ14_18755 [Bacteroidetes bacterium]|nr:hypothetical protein [Bacteroidota bacterium]
MEELFEVRAAGEGTVAVGTEINTILSSMGCQGFNERYLGVVKAVVEKAEGRITKQKLVWGEENDPKFNESQQKNATALLGAAIKAVEGGGDPAELVVKFVVRK